VFTVTGPSVLGGFIVFSWLGFWGLYFLYRAFVLAVPEGRSRTYGRFLFFLPSMVFWPSSIGKESWMVFAIGVAAFGMARVLTGATWKGLAVALLGMWMANLVRPHIAGMLALALAASFLLRPASPRLRQLAPVVKGLSLAVLVTLAVVLIAKTQHFLASSGIDPSTGVSGVLQQIAQRTSEGHSQFAASASASPLHLPFALVTVLFRPMVFEARNLQSIAAALEGTFLLVLTILRLPRILSAIRRSRQMPYVALTAIFICIFVMAFSGVGNFGLLVRERTQVLPFLLVLLAIPRPRPADGEPWERPSVDLELQPEGLA
jgi:hypothetical protein